MKKFYKVLLAITFIVIMFSCQEKVNEKISSDDFTNSEIEYVKINQTTKEAKLLQGTFKELLPEMKELVSKDAIKGDLINKSKDQDKLKGMIKKLSDQSISVFRSYGLNDLELNNFVKDLKDEQLAVMGIVFLAFQASAIQIDNSSTKGIDLSYGKILDCLARALLGVSISDLVLEGAEKIALTTVMQVAKRAAVRALGIIGAAIAIIDFGDCLGIYDVW